MGQIEVLYDLGEPYVRLEDYRSRVNALTAEVERLTAQNADLRAQVLLNSDQGYELARLAVLAGIALHSTTPHEMTEEIAAAVAALRSQLATAQSVIERWWNMLMWQTDEAAPYEHLRQPSPPQKKPHTKQAAMSGGEGE